MLRQLSKVKLISLLLIIIGGCTQNSGINNQSPSEKPNVVSSTTILANLTEEIGGEKINHTAILQPGVDPHVYEPIPQDNITIENADLIIYNGYNLEPNIIRLINSSAIQGEIFAVGELVTPLDFEEDGTPEPDPHVWGDVQNVIVMVQGIRDKLIELKPQGEEVFITNANNLIRELEELDSWIKQEISTIPESQRLLITTHDAFQYYGNAYGLEIPGTLIGISTEEQPSAQTVRNLVETITARGVKAIFAETTINPALINTVAQEAGVIVSPNELYSDSLGIRGSEAATYIGMMRSNTETIVNSLR
jgi:manganese/iron transport system substrate-binding protein